MAVDRTRLKRFPPVQRLWHLGLLVVFMILSVTGIAWMYFETPWGRGLAEQFGGFTGTLEEKIQNTRLVRDKIENTIKQWLKSL